MANGPCRFARVASPTSVLLLACIFLVHIRVAGASSDGPLRPWLMAPVDSLESRQDLPAVAHLLPHLQLTLGSRTLARSQSWSVIQGKFQFLIFDRIVRLRGGGRNKEHAGKGRPDKVMRGKVGKSPKKSTTKKLAPLAKRKKQSDDTTSSKSEEAEIEEEDTDNVQISGSNRDSDPAQRGEEADDVPEMKLDDEDVEADSGADTDLKERKVNREGNVMDEGDEMLRCRDCDKDFAFTVGEQEFFKQKGFDNKPSRCSECKAAKRQSEGFRNRGGREGRGAGRGGGRGGRGHGRGGGGGACYAFQRGECRRGDSCRFQH